MYNVWFFFIQLHSQFQIASSDNEKLQSSIFELQKSNAELEQIRSEVENVKSQLEKELQQVIFRIMYVSCTCIENVMKLIYFQEYSTLDV